MNVCSIVGSNIKKARNSKKLSQEELAVKAEIDRPNLSLIENGHKNLSVVTLDKIARALNVKIASLFSGYKGN